MKIVEVKCNDCNASFEILENFPKEILVCPSCESRELKLTLTDREFNGCGGSCGDCTSCE